MKINSKDLFNYINELETDKDVKFKVFREDMYITDIYWNGIDFIWESGTFTTRAFFNPFYDFEVIEENNKIEKLGYISYNEKNLDIAIIKLAEKINELVEEVNRLKELNE